MNKEEFIKTVDKLIADSQDVLGTFIYYNYFKKYEDDESNVEMQEQMQDYKKYKKVMFSEIYQKWYSKALTIIKAIIPNRCEEFERLYLPSNNRKELTVLNYTIFDAIRTLQIESKNIDPHLALTLLTSQINIMKSIREILELKLNEISNMLEFDVFEKELDSARYLLKNKYTRSAGAICGVIIEKHLINMLSSANLKPTKKNPSINDLNDDLYKNNLIETTQYKFILFLADIRNKCDHNKDKEPTKEEVEDLISGTEKIIKTY